MGFAGGSVSRQDGEWIQAEAEVRRAQSLPKKKECICSVCKTAPVSEIGSLENPLQMAQMAFSMAPCCLKACTLLVQLHGSTPSMRHGSSDSSGCSALSLHVTVASQAAARALRYCLKVRSVRGRGVYAQAYLLISTPFAVIDGEYMSLVSQPLIERSARLSR